MSVLRLRSARFRAEREKRWRELDGLVRVAEREGVRALKPDQLARLPALYRAALASLSVARAIALDRQLVGWLENLCQRAYFIVYGTRHLLGETVGRFLLRTFPATVRRLGRHLLLSVAFMFGAAVAAFVATRADPERYFTFVDAEMAQARSYDSSAEELRETLYSDGGKGFLATFASYLFAHNSRVTLLCFALGFAFGVPTFLLLVMNGLVLGAMSALFVDKGLGVDWFGWILPHGVTELFAICLGGAAGLRLGQLVAFPGEGTRREELARGGREAGALAVGAVAMLVLAALIEGFFRQLVHSIEVRYGVALLTAGAWAIYFGVRRERSA
ncbi:MAG: stage II sporulation protein M [Planctomycetes bacterium]|nr:stage II sporulation protein M [Planctomycetota bacterium]